MVITSGPTTRPRSFQLEASWFDSVTSFLLACMMLLAILTSVLFVTWLYEEPPSPVPDDGPIVRFVTSSGTPLSDDYFDTPSAQEAPDLHPINIHDQVGTLTQLAATMVQQSESRGTSDHFGMPKGDPRQTGPANDIANNPHPSDRDLVPRYERWQIRIVASSIDQYAKQLGFFGIELGAIGGGIAGVDCVSGWGRQVQVRKIIDTAREKRLYLMWTHRSPLEKFDRQLLERAEIQTTGRQLLKFIPSELEHQLATLEWNHAQANEIPAIDQIASTVFQSKSVNGKFEFVVASQRYRGVQTVLE